MVAVRGGRLAVIVAVAALGVVLAGAGPASADCGELCTPAGLAVLGDSDAMAAGLGTGTALSDALVASQAAGGGTAGLASGVGGVSFVDSVVSGTVGLLGGAAAYVGLTGWGGGHVVVAPGGATGLSAGSGGVPGWSAQPPLIGYNGNIPWNGAALQFGVVSGPAYAAQGDLALSIPVQLVGGTYNGYGCYGFIGLGVYAVDGTLLWTGNIDNTNCFLTGGQSKTLTWAVSGFTGHGGFDHIVMRNSNSTATSAGPGTVSWFPAANPVAPPVPVSGGGVVQRSLTCTNGTTTLVVSDSVTVNIGSGGSFPYGPLDCPAGYVVKTFKADLTPSTGGAAQSVIPEVSTPPEVQSIPSQYPDCVTGTCLLRLFKAASAGSPQQSCGDLGIACPDWYLDPNRASDYVCQWGAYVVPTDRCSVYREPGKLLPNTLVNVDGTTTYQTWPPVEPVPSPAPDPAGDAQGCWPSGWSAFNPVQWVLMPAECALSWAFVPQPGALDTAQVSGAFAGTALGAIVPAVTGMGAALSGLGDGACGVVVDSHPAVLQGQEVRISTCDEPWVSVGPVTKNLLAVGFGMGAAVIGIRTILRTIRVDVPQQDTTET